MRVLMVWLACASALLEAGSPSEQASLKRFLQGYVAGHRLEKDPSARYFAAWVDLQGNGSQQVIVQLLARDECGSGGCPTLVLAAAGASFTVVTRIFITRPPIRILTRASHGWHDLGVWVQGGGIQSGYEARLSFDGETYPTNPSIPPAVRLTRKAWGRAVISSWKGGIPLYR